MARTESEHTPVYPVGVAVPSLTREIQLLREQVAKHQAQIQDLHTRTTRLEQTTQPEALDELLGQRL